MLKIERARKFIVPFATLGIGSAALVGCSHGSEPATPEPTNLIKQQYPQGKIPTTTKGYVEAHNAAVDTYEVELRNGVMHLKTPRTRTIYLIGAYCMAGRILGSEESGAIDIAGNNYVVKEAAIKDVYSDLVVHHQAETAPNPTYYPHGVLPREWEWQLHLAAHNQCPQDVPDVGGVSG